MRFSMYLHHVIALWALLAPGTLALDDPVFRLFQQQGCTEMYKDVQGCTEMYRDVQRCTEMYRDVQGMYDTLQGMYRNVQECTGMYRDAL